MKRSHLTSILCLAIACWFPVVSVAATTRTVDLPANSLVFDEQRHLLYASVPSRAGSLGNSVVAIDPATGQMTGFVFVGSEPNALGLSSDGKYLYVGLDGAAAVRRIDLASLTAGLQFSLGADPFFGPFRAEEIEVQPGNRDVIAVSLVRPDVSPRHGGVAIFDHGVKRPEMTQEHTGSDRIEFAQDPALIYGYNNETTEFGFRRLRVDAQEATELDATEGLISGFGVDIEQVGGLIFATSGQVVDPRIPTLTGTFATSFANSVLPEPAQNRALFLTSEGIDTFRLSTFTPLGSTPLPSESEGEPFDLVRWSSDGLAYRTDQDQIVLLGGQTSGPPLPPPGAWLRSSTLPGFEAKVQIDGAVRGAGVADCVAEAICASGAMAGRPEIFIKVIGPRPNGFLWVQISRFTPSRVEIWVHQIASDKINYYTLAPVAPTANDVPGRLDRGAFRP